MLGSKPSICTFSPPSQHREYRCTTPCVSTQRVQMYCTPLQHRVCTHHKYRCTAHHYSTKCAHITSTDVLHTTTAPSVRTQRAQMCLGTPYHHSTILTMSTAQGFRVRFPCLQRKHYTDLPFSPDSSLNFSLKINWGKKWDLLDPSVLSSGHLGDLHLSGLPPASCGGFKITHIQEVEWMQVLRVTEFGIISCIWN